MARAINYHVYGENRSVLHLRDKSLISDKVMILVGLISDDKSLTALTTSWQ